jgi:hypothetical protein
MVASLPFRGFNCGSAFIGLPNTGAFIRLLLRKSAGA